MHHETTWITWHIHYTCKTVMVSVFSSTWKQWKELKKFSTLKSGFEKLRFQWPKTLCMCVWAGGQNTEGKKCFQKYPNAGGRGQSSSPSPTQNSWWMVVRCCLHFFRIRFTVIASFCYIFFLLIYPCTTSVLPSLALSSDLAFRLLSGVYKRNVWVNVMSYSIMGVLDQRCIFKGNPDYEDLYGLLD